MTTAVGIAGRYEGTGSWHDVTGQSQTYRIQQINRLTPDGFEITFDHSFEDGSVIKGKFEMKWLVPMLFSVSVGGAELGNGYFIDDYCHYHLQVGGANVEASYRISGEALRVFGSSTKNADGNYIAWQETLRRVS